MSDALNPKLAFRVNYETVAAVATQTLGVTGAVRDVLEQLIIVPGSQNYGSVTLQDGTLTAVTVFAAGSQTAPVPLVMPFGVRSANGAWKVATGSNVSVFAVGQFT